MTIEDPKGAEGAVARDQALSQAAARHVGLGLRVRGKQPQSDQRLRPDADARTGRQADRQSRGLSEARRCDS